MKKLLAAATLLALSSAQAADLKFGDLNYFLKQGQSNLSFDARINNETGRVNKTNDVEVDGYYFNANYALAAADNLNFFVNVDYLFDVETSVDDSNFNTNGVQSPKFGFNLRLMNQGEGSMNFDVGAVARIKVLDREVGASSPEEEGNMLNPLYSSYGDPRHSLEVNARLGQKWDEANEFYLVAGVIYNFDGEYTDLGTDEDVDVYSTTDLKFGAFYQYRPVNEFMMALGLTALRYDDLYTEVPGNEFKYSDHMDFKFSFDAKYLVNENFIAKFTYGQDRRDNFSEEQNGNTEYDRRTAHSYGLGVDFLF